MSDNYDRLKVLLNQYANETTSQSEENELFDLLNRTPEIAIEPLLTDILEHTEPQPNELRRQRLLERIFTPALPQTSEEKGLPPVRRIFPLRRVAVAASIILMLGVGSYFLFFNKTGKKNEIVKTNNTVPHDVTAPKGTKAMITLVNGQKVLLDSLTSGTLAVQGNVNVVKTADGQIVYNGSSNEIVYNTLFNPRGSKVVSLTLNDGTKIWLNSESSLRYPTAFVGNERNLEITGEAYFEVAKDVTKKFIVSGNGVTTEVLGTHFNVNTYTDESSIKVTLLEGSVKVVKGTFSGMLKPGQQAQVSSDIKIVNVVDVEEVMAWKNGRFQFNKASLQEVMRQIARWYDVEISYEGKIAPQQFGGKMQRDLNLSEVLDGLAKSQVHFRIEGKKVVVMP